MSRRDLPQAPAYWYDGSTPPLPARMLSALYGGATALRRKAYRKRDTGTASSYRCIRRRSPARIN